jgi:hypothetical protein
MLTEFVLDRALEEIGGLRREGLGVTVAVNLGPADLLDLGLPLEISRLLAGHDLPAAGTVALAQYEQRGQHVRRGCFPWAKQQLRPDCWITPEAATPASRLLPAESRSAYGPTELRAAETSADSWKGKWCRPRT